MYNRYCPQGGYEGLEPDSGHAAHSIPSSNGLGALGALPGRLSGLLQALLGGTKNAGGTGIFERLGLSHLDKGDILLVLILVYLFRESEDEEWLIILALVLLMGLG